MHKLTRIHKLTRVHETDQPRHITLLAKAHARHGTAQHSAAANAGSGISCEQRKSSAHFWGHAGCAPALRGYYSAVDMLQLWDSDCTLSQQAHDEGNCCCNLQPSALSDAVSQQRLLLC